MIGHKYKKERQHFYFNKITSIHQGTTENQQAISDLRLSEFHGWLLKCLQTL